MCTNKHEQICFSLYILERYEFTSIIFSNILHSSIIWHRLIFQGTFWTHSTAVSLETMRTMLFSLWWLYHKCSWTTGELSSYTNYIYEHPLIFHYTLTALMTWSYPLIDISWWISLLYQSSQICFHPYLVIFPFRSWFDL